MQSPDSSIAQLYPWQQKQWDNLFLAKKDQRLPHALLLSGPKGVGKLSFALAFCRTLLCLSPRDDQPCGHCNACQLFSSNTHPDLHLIAPEEEGKAVKVDQIREMIEKNSLTSHISAFKLHLVLNAESMNISASNSLLKTLEEPSPNTLIILITSSPELLSATIRSRCQLVTFQVPEPEISVNWLNKHKIKSSPEVLLSMTQGAPLAALAIDQTDTISLREQVFTDLGRLVFGKSDPVKVASDWQNHDLNTILDWMTVWVIDMIRLKLDSNEPIIDNADKIKGLLKIASVFSLQQLFAIYQKQLQAGRLINKQLNKLLLFESLLIPWVANQPH